jgi:hypothetical protein
MIKQFDMDSVKSNGFTVLVYSEAANGKTHLIGDMLAAEKANGPVVYINVAGEDGMLTISKLGLGNIGITVETYADLEKFLADIVVSGKRYAAIGIDSLQMVAKLAMKQVTGSDRMPQIVAGSPVNEWQETHRLMEKFCRNDLKKAAKYSLVACSIDKTGDMLDLSGKPKPKYIAPNLPGKEAQEVAYWFDFVGELRCQATGPGVYTRKFDMIKDNIHIVRQRLPQMITTAIPIPDGSGGWMAIRTEIEKHGG